MVAGRPGALPPLLAACRPRQWTKNLLVFAAPLFAFRFEADVWLPAGGALVAFCLISSAIYLINDCLVWQLIGPIRASAIGRSPQPW